VAEISLKNSDNFVNSVLQMFQPVLPGRFKNSTWRQSGFDVHFFDTISLVLTNSRRSNQAFFRKMRITATVFFRSQVNGIYFAKTGLRW